MSVSINKNKEIFCKTKIIGTLGPSCTTEAILAKLIEEGLDGARFNFSHGSHESHLETIKLFRKVEASLGVKIPCLLDTKGPEIRLGKFEKPVLLKVGQEYTLTINEVPCDDKIACLSHKGITKDVKAGDSVLIDDGLVELKVNKVTDTDLICTVLNEGTIKSNKGVNLPGIKTSLPSLTEKDIGDLKFGVENGFDFVAASFVRTREDCVKIKEYLKKFGGEDIGLIAKIENQEGLDNFDEILKEVDGIMVARGDLGVEIPVERVPIEQKKMINKCNKAGKLVITATQMLDSMINNPRPTRAEVTDVSNAIIDGTSIIMLSGETASGKYPVEAVRYMNKIALETEKHLNYNELAVPMNSLRNLDMKNVEEEKKVLAYSSCVTSNLVKAAAIICTTQDGYTPSLFSKYKPKAPIFAITSDEKVARKLSLMRGVQPAFVNKNENHDIMTKLGIEKFKQMKLLAPGDIVVICQELNGHIGDNQSVSSIMKVQ